MTDDGFGTCSEENSADSMAWYEGLDRILNSHFGEAFDRELMGHLLVVDYHNEIDEPWKASDIHQCIDQLAKAFDVLASIGTHDLPQPVGDAMLFLPIEEIRQSSPKKDEWTTMQSENPTYQVLEAWETLAENKPAIGKLIKEARRAADQGRPRGKKNLEAWRLVAAAQKMCNVRYPGTIVAPNYLNESSPFARLLGDLFFHFKIEGDVVSAFKAWRRHVDSTDPN